MPSLADRPRQSHVLRLVDQEARTQMLGRSSIPSGSLGHRNREFEEIICALAEPKHVRAAAHWLNSCTWEKTGNLRWGMGARISLEMDPSPRFVSIGTAD